MTLRTDDELDAALTRLAELQGVSKQEAARRAILEAAERRGHRSRVDAITADVLVEYADALHRLGTV